MKYLLSFLAVAALHLPAVHAQVPLLPERAGHAATLLNSGKVLITGGSNETSGLNSALLYNPATRVFSATGQMASSRARHTSTRLLDGRVLIVGGETGSGRVLKSAEIYDPNSGSFTLITTPMSVPRSKHTASLLPDGRVLLVGGPNAEIYNPATQTFSMATNPPPDRSSHAAVTLANGTILVTGGYVGKSSVGDGWIFNPENDTFTKLVDAMDIPRANHDMTLLTDGRVLVTGGFTGTSPQDEVDIYDPVAQTFTGAAPMLNHRSNHRSVRLPDGRVLAIGGTTLESGFLAVNEAWNPATDSWSVHDTMAEGRSGPTATVLTNGSVLVAGGITGSKTLPSAEVLDPVTRQFTAISNMRSGRNQHTATLLNDGKVLLAGGSIDATFLDSAEVFDPANDSFTFVGSLIQGRKSHTANLLQNGQVLLTGGKTAAADSRLTELYNPATTLFTESGSMLEGRSLHTATLLDNGKVLVVAGRHGATPLKTCELYDPATNVFSSTGSLMLQRKRHRANALTNGTVLVEGGASLNNGDEVDEGTPTAEVYNTRRGIWQQAQDMHVGRTEHDATLLPDGTVLVSGGISAVADSDVYNPSRHGFVQRAGLEQPRQRHTALLLSHPAWGSLFGKVLIIGGAATGNSVYGGLARALNSVELYDPATREMTPFASMLETRQNHTATLLQDGRVLITGGVDSPKISATAETITP